MKGKELCLTSEAAGAPSCAPAEAEMHAWVVRACVWRGVAALVQEEELMMINDMDIMTIKKKTFTIHACMHTNRDTLTQIHA